MDVYEQSRRQKVYARTGSSRTRQSERGLTDVNEIMKRYKKTGQLPMSTRRGSPVYVDCSKFDGLQSYMKFLEGLREAVIRAQAPLDVMGTTDTNSRNDLKNKELAEKKEADKNEGK